MDEDRPQDPPLQPDSGRPRRAPPTIDLEASEVSGQTQGANAGGRARRFFAWAFSWRPSLPFPSRLSRASATAISTTLVAVVTSAVTAALVIAVAWGIGWSGETVAPLANPQTNASAIDTVVARLNDLEARSAKPAANDPALAARLAALEKSVLSLRGEIAGARTQSEKLAADLDAVKSAPREGGSSPDLAAINERLGEIERATRADSTQQRNPPADDAALRRVVVASMLDVSVRQGEPFAAALDAAKALAADPDALKPLDEFATSGVPNPASLSRELLTLVPKLSPPAQGNSTTGTGVLDRLKAGAAKLVPIERTDVAGNDRSAIVARATAAALRNDLADARRELNTLVPSDRTAAQAWLDKANERDAALAASRQFATEALAALARPAP
jgi:hypothetical protein